MIEKRIIGKKCFFVNVIENDDGSITEQYLDDYLTEMQKVKLKEEKDKLEKEKEKLRLERKKLQDEKQEWNKLKKDAENNVDILDDNPNFLKLCSIEEKECYEYLKRNKLRSTKKDLNILIKSYKWRVNIYPKIKEEKERLNREIEAKNKALAQRKKIIGYTFLIIGIFLTLIICMVGCHYEMGL